MNDTTVANDVREFWKGELRFLPISAAMAIVVGLVVWAYRLDQVGGNPFMMGVLVGMLFTMVIAGCVSAVYWGAILRGAPRLSSLLQKVLWLAKVK